MDKPFFELCSTDTSSKARTGKLSTSHGVIETPVFMPVGTQATVKGLRVEDLHEVNAQVMLSNTYHLLLRPGIEVFRKVGGIHKFMRWDKPVLTDSGGFQIFSLPHTRTIGEEGAVFRSYVDGAVFTLTPELSIEMQTAIGSDIMMVLDECVPSTSDRKVAAAAVERTTRWAERSFAQRKRGMCDENRPTKNQALFGIIQGACFEDLRKQSAEQITALSLDGYAIGGLAVGETKTQREDFTELTASLMPQDKPRYLMGVGTPIDLLEAVNRGVDMLDCILPTAFAQQGIAFTSVGKRSITRTVFKMAEEPLDPNCNCHTCQNYSCAYLHHLLKSYELLGWQLISKHNLHFYHELMGKMRKQISLGSFSEFYKKTRTWLGEMDQVYPPEKNERALTPKRLRRVSMVRGDYEVILSEKGFANVKHIPSNEIMHPLSDPDEEARVLYVEQSRLAAKLNEQVNNPLVLWDVGLGAAHNAMAAISAVENVDTAVKIISFENNLDPLKLALSHPWHFKHIRHAAPAALLKDGKWISKDGKIEWLLMQGDFLETLSEATTLERPEIIFYDPFSYKVNPRFWTASAFAKVMEFCEGRPCSLYTYSSSTAVRAALLASGFYVSQGLPTTARRETTNAFTKEAWALENATSTQREKTFQPLSSRWLERWTRSGAKFPQDLASADLVMKAHFEKQILEHVQFR